VITASSVRKSSKLFACAAAAIVSLAAGSAAFGALLVDFKPSPISPSDPEIKLTGAGTPRQLSDGTGSLGNGDGALPPGTQTVGGLIIQTPVSIVAPGSVASTGGTTLYDVSLSVNGWNTTAAAVTSVIVPPAFPDPGLSIVSQPLGSGRFTLTATDHTTVLLTGTITNSIIVGLSGQTTGSIQSTTVTYDGGLIKNAITAGTLPGSFSWSLLDISSDLAIDSGQLAPFTANMTGLFSTPVIPEPASLGLFGLVGVTAMLRRRSIKR
jgi:hypothetical protein